MQFGSIMSLELMNGYYMKWKVPAAAMAVDFRSEGWKYLL
jgi:hypothetical protein